MLLAGADAGSLTEAGAVRLDGLLLAGIPFAPAEGDAGTGMTATNAVAPRTGNVSAGTSIFSMVVLEHPLKKVYEEIDLVTTPTGKPVAMVHCTNDTNAWAGVLQETAELFGGSVPTGELYTKLYPALYEKYQGVPVRPDMVCLGYPVINFEKDCRNECYMALSGGDESLREKLTAELPVGADYPKTFIWACEDDAMVPYTSAVWMGEALNRAGVPSLLRLYPTGGHGCGTAAGSSAEPWMG